MSLRFNLLLTRPLPLSTLPTLWRIASTGSTITMFSLCLAPWLRDVAISGLYWALITLIDVSLWLIDTTLQFMARDAQAIAFSTFAQAHAPLSEFLALPPAAVPLALLPMVTAPVAPVPDALDDFVPVLALCPAVMPMDFRLWLRPDDSIRRWLSATLPLALAPSLADAVPEEQAVVPVVPSVSVGATVVKKSRRQSNKATVTKKGAGKATDKPSRRRSTKSAIAP